MFLSWFPENFIFIFLFYHLEPPVLCYKIGECGAQLGKGMEQVFHLKVFAHAVAEFEEAAVAEDVFDEGLGGALAAGTVDVAQRHDVDEEDDVAAGQLDQRRSHRLHAHKVGPPLHVHAHHAVLNPSPSVLQFLPTKSSSGLHLVRNFTGLYWVLLNFTGLYWVLLGFNGFYWVLLGSID